MTSETQDPPLGRCWQTRGAERVRRSRKPAVVVGGAIRQVGEGRQELDIRFVPLETLREDQTASQIPQSVLEKPLLNIYVFICEVNNVEWLVFLHVPLQPWAG